jgi:hypothetical protein
MKEEITDGELGEFCQWFKQHYGKAESYESAMITCLCGYFHTFPRQAKEIMRRLKSLELITQKRNMVYLM